MSRRPATHVPQHVSRFLSCLLAMQGLGACAPQESAPAPGETILSVAGSITYRERLALTDTAIAEIELADVSVEGPAEIVSTQRIRNPGQVPIHFKLEIPESKVAENRRYTVQARIYEGERIVFATDTAYPVLTGGNPRIVDVSVIRIGGEQPAADGTAAAADPPLEGSLVSGNVSATYGANFAAGKLVSIQEERDHGDEGKVGAEYQYMDGRLLRYVELGLRANAISGAMERVELDLAFDASGELLAARKVVNDVAATPTLAETDVVRNRAELLRNHAMALKTSREHAH